MPPLGIGLLFVASFALGTLPLTHWAVRGLTGRNLRELGTGNVGVSAAFIHGGKVAGVVAVLAEILRGILPVWMAKIGFPEMPALGLVALTLMVAGRYFLAKGGGVTNATWGVWYYSLLVGLSTAITGLLFWGFARGFRWQNARLKAARWGCLSSVFWVLLWRHSVLEGLAMAGLASLVVIINLRQADDIAGGTMQGWQSLSDKLDATIYGEKAARLSQLKKAGFNVPPGWVLKPENLPAKLPVSLPDSPLIVRSSALGEDGDTSSAAGQYLTVGPVRGEAELREAIERCRQSYWSSEAILYRQQRQLPDTGMAVLIQPYITSQAAGVMFSRNPLDGGSQVIIEAVAGGAEAVVSGQVTPIHFELDFSTEATQEQSLIQGENLEFLPKAIIAELVKKAQEIEALFHGLPQDIEWSWDGEALWILQSRPITNLRPIWTRTIAAEVIPGAIHPLTWSINRPLTCGVWGEIFQIVLGEKVSGLDFNETATLLGSHAYFNATLLGEIFRMMGLPEQGLEFLLRGQKMGKPPLGKVLPSLPGLWRLVQREKALNGEFERDLEQIFNPALQSLAQSQAQSSLVELLNQAEQIQVWLKPLTYYNILGPIGLAIRKAIFRVSDQWLPNETAPEIAAMRQLQDLAAGYQLAMRQNPDRNHCFQAIETQFQAWLNAYGYLSEVGTDIAVPTWQEQPETFRHLLETMAQKPVANSEEVSTKAAQSLGQKWRLSYCYQRVLIKNKISEMYARLLAHLRWTFLAMETLGIAEKALEKPGDIFYLEFREIQQWVREGKTANFAAKIQQRREQLQRDREAKIPPVVYGNQLPKTQNHQEIFLAEHEGIFQGIPASIGCVEGYVKVYRSLADLSAKNPSEFAEPSIIIVPYTDAGWAPLLIGAKAIIAEVGGQLSHGAIIAREYGIPAVMNIPQATARIKDGRRVRVDGYRGIVELLD